MDIIYYRNRVGCISIVKIEVLPSKWINAQTGIVSIRLNTVSHFGINSIDVFDHAGNVLNAGLSIGTQMFRENVYKTYI